MDVIKVSLFGITAVILVLFLKAGRSEWGIIVSMGAGVLIAIYLIGFLQQLSSFLESWENYLGEVSEYTGILWKALGITYLCEFAGNVSRDAGNTLIAAQIELCGKIAVLLLGMPVLWSLVETIMGYYAG